MRIAEDDGPRGDAPLPGIKESLFIVGDGVETERVRVVKRDGNDLGSWASSEERERERDK